jgi:hypothetical protein
MGYLLSKRLCCGSCFLAKEVQVTWRNFLPFYFLLMRHVEYILLISYWVVF